jgi:hypothetical protein|tara:strand:- start:1349 stop:1501 length:153 start_codon:yes stop_codon:yes gene_type:complete
MLPMAHAQRGQVQLLVSVFDLTWVSAEGPDAQLTLWTPVVFGRGIATFFA